MSIPVILQKEAAPWGSIANFGKKLLPKAIKAPNITSIIHASDAASMFRPAWYANLNKALPVAGAGLGAFGSYKSQSKAIREGRQQKMNWGQLAGTAVAGAGAGLAAAQIKPLQRGWSKLTTPTKFLSGKEGQALISKNPQWAKQYVADKPKFLSKDYFKRVGSDLSHPVQSIKALGTDMVYGSQNTDMGPILYKRSPLGMAAAIGMGGVMPAYGMVKTLTDKETDKKDKAINVGTQLLSSATPLWLPQQIINQIPNYAKKLRKKPVAVPLDVIMAQHPELSRQDAQWLSEHMSRQNRA